MSGGCGCGYNYGGEGGSGRGYEIVFDFGTFADDRFASSRVIDMLIAASSSKLSTKKMFSLWGFVYFAANPCN